jgi:hypothetical protein
MAGVFGPLSKDKTRTDLGERSITEAFVSEIDMSLRQNVNINLTVNPRFFSPIKRLILVAKIGRKWHFYFTFPTHG